MYLIQLLVICLVATSALAGSPATKPRVVPPPKEVVWGDKTLAIQDCITLTLNSPNGVFEEKIKEIYDSVFFKKHLGLGFSTGCSFEITIIVANPDVLMPQGFDTTYERYTLDITEEGKAIIHCDYNMGAMRALDTLGQIFFSEEDQLKVSSLPLTIMDEPRYPHRGLSLDVSREFYPLHTLKQIIDGLRMTKANALHLHLSDDDSIPIQLPSYPDMVKYTAFSDKEIYTTEDLKDLVRYANDRGVRVIPEIDIPGHIRALGNYPKLSHLLTCYNKNYKWKMPDGQYIVGGPPSAVLNPTLDETYEFIANVAKDISDIFRYKKLF